MRGLRIGVDADWNSRQTDPDVTRVVREALKVVADLGGDIREARFPDASAIVADWIPHCGVETAVAHEATYPSRRANTARPSPG